MTDGSYNRPLRKDPSSAGWLVYSQQRKKIVLKSSFSEVSSGASSYRGKLLGLLAIHAFIIAVETYYTLDKGPRGKVACDNLEGLKKARDRRKKVPPRASNADILRALRTAHHQITGSLTYEHVYGHQDQRKRWSQLTLVEKLNCNCDSLAKAAWLQCKDMQLVATYASQRLPLESAMICYDGTKIYGECGEEIRFQVGRKEARQFYLTELGWMAATFDAVDWPARNRALSKTSDMFQKWLAKQTSSFCASGQNMGRWFGSEVTCCPNCHAPDETARHLLHCPDSGRQSLLRSDLQSLHSWMREPHTHPGLADMVYSYIFDQGKQPMVASASTRTLYRLAVAQDVIGWDNFMEGKVSLLFHDLQQEHLIGSSSRLTASDWTTQFITRLLHITHGQWIYRNISRHHRRHGLLEQAERKSLLREIDQYMQVAPEDVPEESRFLLEIDFQQIRTASTEKQSYWVHAIRAAVKAGSRRGVDPRRRRRRVPSASVARRRFHRFSCCILVLAQLITSSQP